MIAKHGVTGNAAAALTALGAALALAACGDDGNGTGGERSVETEITATLPQGSDAVELDPASFTTKIDNPYWPMRPGSRWTYRDGDQRIVVTVTDRTRTIANGVEARVVRDVVSEDGEPIEVTDDWYAQDADANVWYLGEDTTEFEDGEPVSSEGSFEAGVDGAEAGVIMPADPEPGLSYRQEYYEGEAEDEAKVLALDASETVPFGSFTDLLQTEDVNPLEDALENKFYARGIGPVLTIDVSGGGGREELIAFEHGG